MYPRLLARALHSSPRSVLLLGPRQVGKSTLLAALEPDLSLNLASPGTFRDFVSHPERLEHELRAAPPSTATVFIDEVQRVPALLDAVQVFLDRRPPPCCQGASVVPDKCIYIIGCLCHPLWREGCGGTSDLGT